MNGIKCPNCELVNLLNAEDCHRCGRSLTDLPSTAQVSVPVEQTYQAQAYSSQMGSGLPVDNETGRKTFFWYRIYCGVLVALNLALVIFGVFAVAFSGEAASGDQEEMILTGVIYGFFGLIFAVVYTVALFLPRKPYNWVVGIVMIALGLTSCCFLPATVPLLIFWLKPETKAFFGKD